MYFSALRDIKISPPAYKVQTHWSISRSSVQRRRRSFLFRLHLYNLQSSSKTEKHKRTYNLTLFINIKMLSTLLFFSQRITQFPEHFSSTNFIGQSVNAKLENQKMLLNFLFPICTVFQLILAMLSRPKKFSVKIQIRKSILYAPNLKTFFCSFHECAAHEAFQCLS